MHPTKAGIHWANTGVVIEAANDIRDLYNIIASAILDQDLPGDKRRDLLELAGLPIPHSKSDDQLPGSPEWHGLAGNKDIRVRTLYISRLIGLKKQHALC